MKRTGVRSTLAFLILVLVFPLAASAQLMIIGNDEKVTWDDAGKLVLMGPGKDTVSIVDISTPESPRIVCNLPLTNSVFGPPVNLAYLRGPMVVSGWIADFAGNDPRLIMFSMVHPGVGKRHRHVAKPIQESADRSWYSWNSHLDGEEVGCIDEHLRRQTILHK